MILYLSKHLHYYTFFGVFFKCSIFFIVYGNINGCGMDRYNQDSDFLKKFFYRSTLYTTPANISPPNTLILCTWHSWVELSATLCLHFSRTGSISIGRSVLIKCMKNVHNVWEYSNTPYIGLIHCF